MAAYVIFSLVAIPDPAKRERYGELARPSVAQYGGRFLVRGVKPETAEGEWRAEGFTVIEFDSLEAARRWWDSPEYQHARAVLDGGVQRNVVLVEGL